MIRSHSVSGDLHGVQPDPIAADILRKEPEQETFARLKISPTGIDILSFDIHKFSTSFKSSVAMHKGLNIQNGLVWACILNFCSYLIALLLQNLCNTIYCES